MSDEEVLKRFLNCTCKECGNWPIQCTCPKDYHKEYHYCKHVDCDVLIKNKKYCDYHFSKIIKCKQCGKEFIHMLSRKKVFCSQECFRIWQKIPEHNPMFGKPE